MRLAVGVAGVPSEVFDNFRRAERKIVEADDLVLSQSFKRADQAYYRGEHAQFIINAFADMLAGDAQNTLRDTGLVVLYVSSHAGAEAFAERFFPSILAVPINWKLEGYNRTTRGPSFNDLQVLLRERVQVARRAVSTVKKEVSEHDGRTPLLLPLHNFRSGHLVPAIRRAHGSVQGGAGLASVTEIRREFERHHPPQMIGEAKRRCFVDDAGIEFHPPGGARHAFARAIYKGHPPTCLLSGRRRLGAPYDRAFHYDCKRERRRLSGTFVGCHGDDQEFGGSDYINIAPNDYLRGGDQQR